MPSRRSIFGMSTIGKRSLSDCMDCAYGGVDFYMWTLNASVGWSREWENNIYHYGSGKYNG